MSLLGSIIEHMDDNDGYCTHCKKITVLGGVEPDATGYPCPECDKRTVMGVEEAILSGKIKADDGNGVTFNESDFGGIFG